MSNEVKGLAYLTEETESEVCYKYGSFYRDDPEHYDDKLCDGQIIIHKDLLAKFPDRRQLGANKVVKFKNCSNCRAKTTDEFEIDFVALALLGEIFKEYDKTKIFPKECSICK